MGQQRQTVSIGRKQEVINWIETVGEGMPTRAVAHFRASGWSIDGGAVRRWWRLREKIRAAVLHQARVAGGGRKPLSETLEELLYEEFVTKRTKKEKVSAAGWLVWLSRFTRVKRRGARRLLSLHQTNFMRRFEISLRRRTNLTVLDDDVLVDRAVRYMSFLQDLLPAVDLEQTVLMDETAVYFEDARQTSLDFTGARHVVVRSTGFSSMRITVVLAVSATGRKLPPLLVWKGKISPSFEKRPGPLYVAQQPRAWVDSELLKKWIDLAFPLVINREGKCLVWDSMRAHISKVVKAKCSARKIAMCVVPGGLTPYLQAGDIGIYKSFKDLLYLEINAWKESDQSGVHSVW